MQSMGDGYTMGKEGHLCPVGSKFWLTHCCHGFWEQTVLAPPKRSQTTSRTIDLFITGDSREQPV